MLSDVEEIGLIFDPEDLPLDVAAEGRRVALGYSVVLDWSEELGFTGACVELPRLSTRTIDATACVEQLFEQAAAQVATILAHGLTPPPAVRSSAERKMSRPATPGTAVLPSVHEPPTFILHDEAADDLELPTLGQLSRMARSTADQYRIVMHWSDGSYYGTSPEVPAASGFGVTPNGCVDDLRRQLARHVADLIVSNRMPPEPMQDLERRPQPHAPRRAA
jgi:predicted RNase H-like HicB family nuclease